MPEDVRRQIAKKRKQGAELFRLGEREHALAIASEVSDLTRQAYGERHPEYAMSLNNLAACHMAVGDYAVAEPLFREALEIDGQVAGENHPDYLSILSNLAALHYYTANYAQSALLYRHALAIKARVLGETAPDYITSLAHLAGMYRDMGDRTAAELLMRQGLDIQRRVLGEDHPDYAISLNNLAVLYQEMGNYAAAEPLLRQAVDNQRATLGETNPDYATSLNNLAELYRASGNDAAAEPLLRQATAIWRLALGEKHPNYATGLNNLAALHQALGNHEAAEPLFREALEIRRAVLDGHHSDVAQSLTNLAGLYMAVRNYAAAEPLYRQALEITRTTRGEHHPDCAGNLTNLGTLFRGKGHLAAAETLYRQALDLLKESHPGYPAALFNLASVYHRMANYAAAEALYRQALEYWRQAGKEDHPDYAKNLSDLGMLLHEMARYPAAEVLYRQALEILGKDQKMDRPQYATSLNNLAGLFRDMANYSAAEPLLRQALEIRRSVLGSAHPAVAESLGNLAALYMDMNEGDREGLIHVYPTVLLALREALEITRTSVGEAHPDYANRLAHLARLHMLLGRSADAMQLYQRALTITRTALGENHPRYAALLDNVSGLWSFVGDFGAAEPLCRRALEIRRTTLGDDHPFYATGLVNLAMCCAALSRESEAMQLMQQATSIRDRMIGQVFSISSERHRLAYLRYLQTEFDLFLSLAVQQPADSRVITSALDLVLHRKCLSAEALAVQRDSVLGGRYPTLEPELRELRALRAQIAQTVLTGAEKAGTDDFRDQRELLAEWNARQERLEAALASHIPEMNLEQQLRGADSATVAKSLPTGAALIEYVRFRVFDFKEVEAEASRAWQWDHALNAFDEGERSRYLAFVLSASTPAAVQMIDLGASASIDRMIAAFRAAAEGGDSALTSQSEESEHGRATTRAGELRSAVFDRLLPALGGRTRLFVAPDGDLSRLPFEALPLDDGRRIIDAYQISYVSTGRDVLRFFGPPSDSPQPSVVVADPDFNLDAEGTDSFVEEERPLPQQAPDLDRSLRFSRLTGTRQEGERVGACLGVPALMAERALEGRLKTLRSPHILHLATHGFFLPDLGRHPRWRMPSLDAGIGGRLFGQHLENPLLRSGLALAGANTWLQGKTPRSDAEDGLLTAEDVTGLDLLGTELVVLSACDTGLGEVSVGEGVFGLRRAFILAGARTLVMSLWKVPDLETQQLMADFYQRLLAKTPRAEALRLAQLAMKKKNPDPYYWGAFICQGDPGPVGAPRR